MRKQKIERRDDSNRASGALEARTAMPAATTQISAIGFDADDTLWQNEQFFKLTAEGVTALLKEFAEPGHLSERLLEAEKRNIQAYGFGIKGFTLSMIETAIE